MLDEYSAEQDEVVICMPVLAPKGAGRAARGSKTHPVPEKLRVLPLLT